MYNTSQQDEDDAPRPHAQPTKKSNNLTFFQLENHTDAAAAEKSTGKQSKSNFTYGDNRANPSIFAQEWEDF
ncbi:hypothetical protein TSAR_004533 [Trichomalopsis sarcophagae]|uniref:Uncharacterized protein n=1 Tax=Trichomalopsis sarcophagae TaxID=543379 RepID=A0A232EMD5_9HYME|nr:hypothetical protein TSAR_004533 [Trichomalopsis sarcophagae]